VILRQGAISLEELENAVRFFDPHIRVIANDKNG